jgi:hypothetical protein
MSTPQSTPPSTSAHDRYAADLARHFVAASPALRTHPDDDRKLTATKKNGDLAVLDCTPFVARARSEAARDVFSGVRTTADLIRAYHTARRQQRFEDDLPGARDRVHDYATIFMRDLLARAEQTCTDEHARMIARWVGSLDVYVAVKAVESLLNSKADMGLMDIAARRNWIIHFDHLAIRCGHSGRRDAERVVRLLCDEHGYVASQVRGEDFYQFSDGWNAYPLYKLLDNGQVLRLFIDQSDANAPKQIIQHWNRVYGYTAHHMGLRATVIENGRRRAVSLQEMMDALAAEGLQSLTPTGHYTEGLLLQVFTRPERDATVPTDIKREVGAIDPELERTIENAKLLEMVSRREVPEDFARRYFELYGLRYDATQPLHSVPGYHYFLPAQAAHVIKTSVQTS